MLHETPNKLDTHNSTIYILAYTLCMTCGEVGGIAYGNASDPLLGVAYVLCIT